MASTAIEADGYLPVSLATIRPSECTEFQLFIRETPETPIRLYRGKSYPFSADDHQRLCDRGVKKLYVTLNDHERYQKYLRKTFVATFSDESVPISRRFGCLNEVVRDVLSEAFSGRDTGKTVKTAEQFASQIVELVSQADDVVPELLQVLRHDYHTFTHSANVAYYCVILAKACGIDEVRELEEIATGALLHDLGKLYIPDALLQKRGRLNRDEWHVMKHHPTHGFRLLADHGDLSLGQLMMVYQHHEHLDGSGYPVGITESRIHPWAQLCTIVDVFEALTSHRPYRPALSAKEAIAIMDRLAETRLHPGMWQCWKTILQDS